MTVSPSHPVPFIVGSARSGTTLLRAMLDAHPLLAIPGESHFIPRLRALRARYERRSGFDVARYCADLARDRYFSAWGLPADDLRADLVRVAPDTVEAAIRQTYQSYAATRGKERWGDKTPAYVLHVGTISSMLPEARFLHVIRDGRDVSRSLTDLGWASSIEDAALRWAFRVRKGREAGRLLGADRYLEVRYEDLISETAPTLHRICSFLDIPFDEQMAEPHRRAGSVLATLRNPENHQRLHLPPTQVRNWREELTERQVIRFEAVAGELLGSLGYERAIDRIPFPTRVAGRARTAASLPKRMSSRFRRVTWIG